jgi:outer membrane protein OmpA-like peptidoglycan-associated protein
MLEGWGRTRPQVIGDTAAMRLRASCLASFALLVGLAMPAIAAAQGTVTFGGGAPDTPPPPPPPPSPDAPVPPAAAPPAAAAPGPAATAPVLAEGQEGDEAAQAAEWAERDRAVNESNTLNGGTGLLKTQHAQTGAPGQFRIGFVTEWFSGGFLCTKQYPCRNNSIALGQPGATSISDTMNHVGGTLSLGVSVAKLGAGTLDAYGSIVAYANSDTANAPALLQVLGDMNLGLKYVAPLSPVAHVGLFSELWLINGSGAVGLDGHGTSAKFGGVGTLDLRGLESHTPLRFSVNAVYFVDNSADVLSVTEQQRGTPVTRIERYGLGVNRVDQFQIFIGGELFAAEERVRPFIEEKIGFANNRQGYRCQPSNQSKDGCLANDVVIPSTLTIGSRFFPWKRGFSLLAAVDIGTGGTGNFIEELQPIPPWTLYFGAGWAVDTQDRPPVIRTKLVEKPVDQAGTHGHVVGFVHEKDKNDPVAGAYVAYHDRADLSPLGTGPDGKFADDLPAGQYTFDIKAEGFRPGSCDTTVPKEGGSVAVDCPLEAQPRAGVVNGHVHDADTNQPVAGVQVVVDDSQKKEARLSTDASGGFRFDAVAPGTAQISVQAEGYLVLVMPADVRARTDNTFDLMLRPKPKSSLVTVGRGEITIKQQIQFALDSAVILPESFGLLTEIADTLIRHQEIRRVEVQGHTDNSGTAEHNKGLSEQRAEAVRAWLVQHGVPTDKLVAHGYGQDRPIAPNVTAGNRARNRRVQFIILDKEGGAPPPPAAPGDHTKHPLPGF